MKISVIIPTYKPKEYLWECLDSLVKQSFKKEDFEVILVLNGYIEPYKSAIEDYIAENMRNMNVKFICTSQVGVSNARNIALNAAKGEYISFIDDDDFVSPNYLRELYNKVSYDTISLCYPYAFTDGDISQVKYKITDSYDKRVKFGKQSYMRTRKFFSGPCMKLIPMTFIQDRRFDIRFKNGEDSLFMFVISDNFKWVNFTSKNAIYYRRHREGSAVALKRSWNKIIQNQVNLIINYTKIYFGNPFKYDLGFFLTRVIAAIYSMILKLLKY